MSSKKPVRTVASQDAEAEKPAADPASPPWLPLVLEGVDSLNFGTVQIVVHNSKVVQVERLERHRFQTAKE